MLQQKTKFFKKFKLKQLQTIKQTYKYIYFFRYTDINLNKIISLKKNIKKINYKSLIINQNLAISIFPNLKGQSSLLIIYGNNDLFLLQNFIYFKKFKLIYLFIQNNFYSYFKIKELINTNSPPLNNLIMRPFLNFIYYLRKI